VTVNPLVAARVDGPKDAWSGVWIAEDIELISQGISSGNWIDTTLGALGASLDGLAMISDPAGALLQYGVSWLIEQIKPLSEALDWLAGDPAQIATNAQTWRNVAASLHEDSTRLAAAAQHDLINWHGLAADAYQTWATQQQQAMTGLAKGAEAIATITEGAGFLVAAVRILVRDAIATVVSRLIVYAIEEAGSLGFATPLVIEQATTLVASWAAKIARWLEALIASLRRLGPIITHLGELIGDLKNILNRLRGGGEPVPGGGRAAQGSRYRTPAKGTPEWAARREELAHDPAQGGRIKPKSSREADIGLALEERGDLPGPIRRAELDNTNPARQLDRGEFIDANGQHWDMKSPADIYPAGRYEGQPMQPGLRGRYDGPEFERTIVMELSAGQNVVLDTFYLSPLSLADLERRVAGHPEWNGKVVFYP
jgi:uncharacterized protein YukE